VIVDRLQKLAMPANRGKDMRDQLADKLHCGGVVTSFWLISLRMLNGACGELIMALELFVETSMAAAPRHHRRSLFGLSVALSFDVT
jgi:hypothetical protein